MINLLVLYLHFIELRFPSAPVKIAVKEKNDQIPFAINARCQAVGHEHGLLVDLRLWWRWWCTQHT